LFSKFNNKWPRNRHHLHHLSDHLLIVGLPHQQRLQNLMWTGHHHSKIKLLLTNWGFCTRLLALLDSFIFLLLARHQARRANRMMISLMCSY
jgi:hypothetical protein